MSWWKRDHKRYRRDVLLDDPSKLPLFRNLEDENRTEYEANIAAGAVTPPANYQDLTTAPPDPATTPWRMIGIETPGVATRPGHPPIPATIITAYQAGRIEVTKRDIKFEGAVAHDLNAILVSAIHAQKTWGAIRIDKHADKEFKAMSLAAAKYLGMKVVKTRISGSDLVRMQEYLETLEHDYEGRPPKPAGRTSRWVPPNP